MSGPITAVLTDALALFRHHRDTLLRVAPPFLFLPPFALALLVPPPPAFDGQADADGRQAWAEAVVNWAAAQGGWYVLAYAVGFLGAACLYALFLDRSADTVGTALRRGLTLAPRLLLAMLVVALPTGAGLYLWVLPGLYVMGRTLLVGAVLVAERPTGAIAAIGRSVALTKGRGLQVTALAVVPLIGGWLFGQPFAMIAGVMRAGGAANPVALAVVDAGGAAVAMAAGVAQALIAVAAYRRWASAGI